MAAHNTAANGDKTLVETTVAIDYARRLSQSVINSIVIPVPQVVLNTQNNIKVTNVPQYLSSSFGTAAEANTISASISISMVCRVAKFTNNQEMVTIHNLATLHIVAT